MIDAEAFIDDDSRSLSLLRLGVELDQRALLRRQAQA